MEETCEIRARISLFYQEGILFLLLFLGMPFFHRVILYHPESLTLLETSLRHAIIFLVIFLLVMLLER
jgi:hypothetical protein